MMLEICVGNYRNGHSASRIWQGKTGRYRSDKNHGSEVTVLPDEELRVEVVPYVAITSC